MRAYASNEIRDLEFLRFFPFLRRLDADGLYLLDSLEGLRHLPEDTELLVSSAARGISRSCPGSASFAISSCGASTGSRTSRWVGRLPRLRYLFLQTLSHVRSIPDLSEARALRRIHLETMKGIRDLRPLATAPALEEVLLLDMPQLQPDDLRALLDAPNLTAVTPALGGMRKNRKAREILGLPNVRGERDLRRGIGLRS